MPYDQTIFRREKWKHFILRAIKQHVSKRFLQVTQFVTTVNILRTICFNIYKDKHVKPPLLIINKVNIRHDPPGFTSLTNDPL